MVRFSFINDEFGRSVIEIFIGMDRETPLILKDAEFRAGIELSDFVRVIDVDSGNLIAEFARVKKG